MSQTEHVWDRVSATIKACINWRRNHRFLVFLLPFLVLCAALGPMVGRQFLSKQEMAERERESPDLVRKRAEWFFRPRASANGHVPGGLRLKALAELDARVRVEGTLTGRGPAFVPGIQGSQTQWTALGPQPVVEVAFFGAVSGRVTALAVDACDSTGNTVYLGAAEGGVWKTTNGGQTWTPLTDQQDSLATGSIALDPNCTGSPAHSSVIYVGTGEENFTLDSIYGAGVLKSTDGGATWSHDQTFGNGAGISRLAGGPFIGALAVSPNQTSTILAAVQTGDILGDSSAFPSGLYRSTDSGTTWSNVGAAGTPATSVLFDPNSPTTAFAALGNPIGQIGGNGVYMSSDGGATWTGLTSLNALTGGSTATGRITLTAAPAGSPRALYAAIASAATFSSNLLGVFKSTDGGTTWTQLNGIPPFCNQQCFYDMALAVAPSSGGNVIFAGGGARAISAAGVVAPTVIRSTDGGNSWSDVSLDGGGHQVHVDHHAFGFAPTGNKIYAGNDGGVWSSSDVVNPATAGGAQHWVNLNGTLNITQFYPGNSIHPSSDQIIFAGSQDNGTDEFTGSLTWNNVEACGDGGFSAIDPLNPSTIFAACAFFPGSSIFNRNRANGDPNQWASIQRGIDVNDGGPFIPPLVIDSKTPTTLYIGTFRLYQSVNSGDSWRPITLDLTNGVDFIDAVGVAPSDSNTVYVGTGDPNIWVSTNAQQGASATFTKVGDSSLLTTTGRPLTAIAVGSTDPSTAVVTFSGFSGCGPCDRRGHIYKTVNRGGTWGNIDGNTLPDIPVNDVVIDPNDPTGNTMYIATDVGVLGTRDNGVTWTTLAPGLPKVVVLSLKLRNASRTLVAGTHGRGAWSLLLPGVPAFALTALSPGSSPPFTTPVTIAASGTGFTPTSVINFNGTNLTTDITGIPTTLRAPVSPSMVASGGGFPVNVTDTATAKSTNTINFSVFGDADFKFGSPSPSSNSVTAGLSANYTLSLSPAGNTGTGVSLSCSVSPPTITISCAFDQNPVTPLAGGKTANVTVATKFHTSVTPGPRDHPAPAGKRHLGPALFLLAAAMILVFAILPAARRRLAMGLACAVTVLALGVMAACGGGGGGGNNGGGGTPSGTYTIIFNGQAGSFLHSSPGVQLIVH